MRMIAPYMSLLDAVEAVRAIPYGRPSDRTVESMLHEQRGTCSTKHLHLARVLSEYFPDTEPQIIHRVYTLTPSRARQLFGTRVSTTIPEDGLIDVHRYLEITLNGHRTRIDVTFPGPAWDATSPLPLACDDGIDYPASDDPDADKQELEEIHCNHRAREKFIAALSNNP
jgi:hypothetical protein